MRQLLDPSGHPQRAKSHPSKTSLYFYLYSALPPAIQFHLPNTLSLNTCAIFISQEQSTGLHSRLLFSLIVTDVFVIVEWTLQNHNLGRDQNTGTERDVRSEVRRDHSYSIVWYRRDHSYSIVWCRKRNITS